MQREGLLRVVAALATVTTLVGCAQGQTSAEPDDVAVGQALNVGYDAGSVCIPAPDDDDVMFGDTLVRPEGEEPVTISDVSLVAPEHMSLRQAFLVEVAPGETVVGFRRASDTGDLPKKWDGRVEADGAVLRPGQQWNLVLVVDSPPDVTATAEAARIHYRHRGKQFTQDTLTQIASAPSCDGVLFD